MPPNDNDLSSTSAAIASGAPRLGLMLADKRWLVAMADVAEVVPVPAITRVPLTMPWYAGMANLRGSLISVVDFSAFLGGSPVAMHERTRLLVIGDKYRVNCGLLFERVIGLRHLDQFERETNDSPRANWVSASYRDAEGHTWNALSMHALVSHPDFLQIELTFD